MQKITPEDSAIIARYHRGDSEALEQLVQRHRRRAYSYAFRLTRNADEASDIVAEAFVRVCRSIDTFRGDSSFTTWLYRVETNCFLDMRKKTSRQRIVSFEDVAGLNNGQAFDQIADYRKTPYECIETKERISFLERLIQQLPKGHRTVLMLYHAEAMSYEEIADVLELPIGTVNSRLNRARIQLRDSIRNLRRLSSIPGTGMRAQVNL